VSTKAHAAPQGPKARASTSVASATIVVMAHLGGSVVRGPALLSSMLAVCVGYFGLLAVLREWDLTEWHFAGRVFRNLLRPVGNPFPKGERYD